MTIPKVWAIRYPSTKSGAQLEIHTNPPGLNGGFRNLRIPEVPFMYSTLHVGSEEHKTSRVTTHLLSRQAHKPSLIKLELWIELEQKFLLQRWLSWIQCRSLILNLFCIPLPKARTGGNFAKLWKPFNPFWKLFKAPSLHCPASPLGAWTSKDIS